MHRVHWKVGAVLSAVCLAVSAGCTSAARPGPSPSSSIGAAGSVVSVGLTTDLPGWGVLKAGSNIRSGFDVDLMNWLGSQRHFTPNPVEVTFDQRISAVQNGTAQLVLANFSITDERRKKVSFAGPYMITQQGVMVRAGDDRVEKIDDLAGKSVCTASGTTSLDQLNQGRLKDQITIVAHPGLRECVDDLNRKAVDAVSTDQLVLDGFAREDRRLELVPGLVFGAQDRYAIGLPHGDLKTCEIFTQLLREFLTSGAWDIFFKKYFPDVSSDGHRPDPYKLDSCE